MKTTGMRDGLGAGAGIGPSLGAAHAARPVTPPATASFRTSRRVRSIILYNPGRPTNHPETGARWSPGLTSGGAAGAGGAMLRGISCEVVHLNMKVVRRPAEGRLEEAAGVAHRALLARAVGEIRQPDQVDHERRRERRVAPLPRELERHPRPEEPLEVD